MPEPVSPRERIARMLYESERAWMDGPRDVGTSWLAMADALLAAPAGAESPAWNQIIRQTLDETGLFGAHQIDVATDRLVDALTKGTA